MSRPQHYATRNEGQLTPRQREIVALIAAGRTNFEIAEALGITIDGAKWHVREILAKLQCDSREQVAAAWREQRRLSRRLARSLRSLLPLGGLKLAAAGASFVVVAAVVVAAVVIASNGSDGGAAAGANPPSATPTPSPSAATPTPVVSTPLADGPVVRIAAPAANRPATAWVVGGENASALGDAMQRLASTGALIAPTNDAHVSSGLTRPDYFDWPPELKSIAAANPTLVIVTFGLNDWQGMTNPDGSVVSAMPGSPAWTAAYARRVGQAMSLLAAPGRLVLWLGQPVMQSPAFDDHMQQLGAIARQAAANHPGVLYVDTRALFGNADGNFLRDLPTGPGGALEDMRTGADGAHYSPQGADRLAAYLIREVQHSTGVNLQPQSNPPPASAPSATMTP